MDTPEKPNAALKHSFPAVLQPRILSIVLFLFMLSGCTSYQHTTASPPLGAAAVSTDYVLGPEDILEISVWKDESLTKQLVIRPDGKISFPLIGEIQAGGLSVQELQRHVAKRISEFAPDPTVTVIVLQVKSNKVYVVGKVNRPGEYATGCRPDVMQVISMAGGLTPFASPGEIVILRRENGVMKKILFNYDQVAKGKHLEQNIILQRGDVIVVP